MICHFLAFLVHKLKQLEDLGSSIRNSLVSGILVVLVILGQQLDCFGHGHTRQNSLHLAVRGLLALLGLMRLVLLDGLVGSYL